MVLRGPPPEQAVEKTMNQRQSLPWSSWRFRRMVMKTMNGQPKFFGQDLIEE